MVGVLAGRNYGLITSSYTSGLVAAATDNISADRVCNIRGEIEYSFSVGAFEGEARAFVCSTRDGTVKGNYWDKDMVGQESDRKTPGLESSPKTRTVCERMKCRTKQLRSICLLSILRRCGK